MEYPRMHCHEQLEYDRQKELLDGGMVGWHTMTSWFDDAYSTSKHLLVLYSIAIGLKAKIILEIGFGLSTFVLARAAKTNGGYLYSCDNRDFSYLLTDAEKEVTTFIHGNSWDAYEKMEAIGETIDFAFLDYFSNPKTSQEFIEKEVSRCYLLLSPHGILAVHDAADRRYKVRDAIRNLPFLGLLAMPFFLPYNYGLGLFQKYGASLEDPWLKKPEIGRPEEGK